MLSILFVFLENLSEPFSYPENEEDVENKYQLEIWHLLPL